LKPKNSKLARTAPTTRSCPLMMTGPLSAKLLKNGTLKTYEGFPHGMLTIHADVINPDLLAFIKS
jgi:non-heme chloroperoxidase